MPQGFAFPDRRQSFVPDFPDLGNTSEEFRDRLPALYGAYIVSAQETGDCFGPGDSITRRQAAEMFQQVCSTLSPA